MNNNNKTTTAGCYLGHKNQHHNRCGSDKEAETCEHSEQVDLVSHSVGENKDDHKHKTADVCSQDNLPVVIQSFHLDFSGFKSHYDCSSM